MESYFDDERVIIGTMLVLGLLAVAAAYYRHRKDQGDEGLGDTVAHVLGKVGIHKSPGCGCEHRQDDMNHLIPY
jgi:hypothetical protein